MGGWEEKKEKELRRSRMNQAAAEWVEIIEPRTKVSPRMGLKSLLSSICFASLLSSCPPL